MHNNSLFTLASEADGSNYDRKLMIKESYVRETSFKKPK